MRVSICIPQYNRIKFLLYSLEQIEKQTYNDLEIVISDDCSTDNTEEAIKELQASYKHPIVYNKQLANQGYDKNLRTSIEKATGEYVIIIGNDDTINPNYDLSDLVFFLQENDFPDIGYTSFIDAAENKIESRAKY